MKYYRLKPEYKHTYNPIYHDGIFEGDQKLRAGNLTIQKIVNNFPSEWEEVFMQNQTFKFGR